MKKPRLTLKISSPRTVCAARLLTALALSAAGSSTYAATGTWNNSAGGAWDTTANWAGQLLPSAADEAYFVSGTGAITLATDISILSLKLGGTSPTFKDLTFGAIGGKSITFGNNGQLQIQGTVNNNAATAFTVNAPLVIDSVFTISNDQSKTTNLAALVVAGDLKTTSTTSTLNLGGVSKANNTISGNINRDIATTKFDVIKNGLGTWTLSGSNNTYNGSTRINAGTLTIGSTGNINSTSGVMIRGAEFNYNSTIALTQKLTFFFGVGGGTLSGTGTINTDVTITSGNTVAAGAIAGEIGTLRFGGKLTGSSNSIFSFNINSSTGTSDLLAVTGAVDLGSATLALSDLGAPALNRNTTLTLLTGSSVSGTFLNQAEGSTINLAGNNYAISYLNNAVKLQFIASAIPEPSTYAILAGIGILGFAVCSRRRNNKVS